MPGATPLVYSYPEQTHRLAGIADTVGALLGAFDLLPSRERVSILAVCKGLANDLATALAAIDGEAV